MAESDTPSVDGLMFVAEEFGQACCHRGIRQVKGLSCTEVNTAVFESAAALRAYAERLAASPAGLKPELQKSETAHATSQERDDLQTALPRWEPIGTRPMDGTRYLAICGTGVIRLVRQADIDDRLPIAADVPDGVWPDLPTHWMPLPLPPGESADARPTNEKAPVSAVAEALQVLRDLKECGAVNNWLRVSNELKARVDALVGAAPGVGE